MFRANNFDKLLGMQLTTNRYIYDTLSKLQSLFC